MSKINAVLRQYWVQGINDIVGKTSCSLPEWYGNGDYTVTHEIHNEGKFCLSIHDSEQLLRALAYDIDRLAAASFETMHSVKRDSVFPKSFGWLIIKCYYAAFFSAHAILRILGISCSQLDTVHVNRVNEIATIYNCDNGKKIKSGYYRCHLLVGENSSLDCSNLKSRGGGSHELFWKLFRDELSSLGAKIMSSSLHPTEESQPVYVKIDEIRQNLCLHGCNGGNWLSSIRNTVNYKHELDAWFPSPKKAKDIADNLYRIQEYWLTDPLNIPLEQNGLKDKLPIFMKTCSFIVGLCRVMLQDMERRCQSGRSYLTYGSIQLLNMCSQNSW
jgi:hypothetical protein